MSIPDPNESQRKKIICNKINKKSPIQLTTFLNQTFCIKELRGYIYNSFLNFKNNQDISLSEKENLVIDIKLLNTNKMSEDETNHFFNINLKDYISISIDENQALYIKRLSSVKEFQNLSYADLFKLLVTNIKLKHNMICSYNDLNSRNTLLNQGGNKYCNNIKSNLDANENRHFKNQFPIHFSFDSISSKKDYYTNEIISELLKYNNNFNENMINNRQEHILTYEKLNEDVIKKLVSYFQTTKSSSSMFSFINKNPESLIKTVTFLLSFLLALNLLIFILYNRIDDYMKNNSMLFISIIILIILSLIFDNVVNYTLRNFSHVENKNLSNSSNVGNIYSIIQKSNPFYRSKQRKKIIFIGDDFIDKFNQDNNAFSHMSFEFKGTGDIKIRSYNGYKTSQLTQIINTLIKNGDTFFPHLPTVIFLMFGINDASLPTEISVEQYKTNLLKAVKLLKGISNKFEVILITPCPVCTLNLDRRYHNEELTIKYTEKIREIKKEHGVKVMDLWVEQEEDFNKQICKVLNNEDGAYLNPKGIEAFTKIFIYKLHMEVVGFSRWKLMDRYPYYNFYL